MEQPKGPQYYRRGSIEPWDYIRDQGLNYHLGNAVKYISRAGYKDSAVSDLKKAIHYLENELQHITERASSGVQERIPDNQFDFWQKEAEIFDR